MVRRFVPALAAAGAAGAVAVGAVAVASIPDAEGVIHSCYNNDTGALRVIDPPATRGCNNAETELSFNQKGPAGPAGPAGAAGPAGPEGSTRSRAPKLPGADTKAFGAPTRALSGSAKRRVARKFSQPASDSGGAFSTWRDAAIAVPDEGDINPLDTSSVTLGALEVPAGRYVAVAKATLFRRADLIRCRLQAGADYDTSFQGGETAWEGMTLTVVHRFTQPGRVELRCYQSGAHPTLQGFPKNSTLYHVKITAMQFGDLSNKPF
jgi:hypothetical protein